MAQGHSASKVEAAREKSHSLLIYSKRRHTGTTTRFQIRVQLPALQGPPRDVKLHLDYITPIVMGDTDAAPSQIYDSIEVDIAAIPQLSSYNTKTATHNTVVAVLCRDYGVTQTEAIVLPASKEEPVFPGANQIQVWKQDLWHDPMEISQEIFRTNILDVTLRFVGNFPPANPQTGTYPDAPDCNASLQYEKLNFYIADFMMKFTLTYKDV